MDEVADEAIARSKHAVINSMEMMTPLDWAKEVTGLIISWGVGYVVTEIVMDNIEADTKKDRTKRYLGRVGISMVAKHHVQQVVNQRWDNVAEVYRQCKQTWGYVMNDEETEIEETFRPNPRFN